MKEIRFNANLENSKELRKLQAEFQRRMAPSKISLDALVNLTIKVGLDRDQVREELKLT